MANSYSGDPAGSDADAVRFQLGDTNTTAGQYNFEDEEVAYALAIYQSNVLVASAYLARVMATRYADKRDRNVGPLSISYDQQYRRWTETADKLMKMSVSRPKTIAWMTPTKNSSPKKAMFSTFRM